MAKKVIYVAKFSEFLLHLSRFSDSEKLLDSAIVVHTNVLFNIDGTFCDSVFDLQKIGLKMAFSTKNYVYKITCIDMPTLKMLSLRTFSEEDAQKNKILVLRAIDKVKKYLEELNECVMNSQHKIYIIPGTIE